MNIYKMVLDNAGTSRDEAILKILYDYHMENDASDAGEIQHECGKLDQLLCELILKDYDRIWDVAMKLCGLHEERGFDAGFRMAVNLARELQEPEQGRDS